MTVSFFERERESREKMKSGGVRREDFDDMALMRVWYRCVSGLKVSPSSWITPDWS